LAFALVVLIPACRAQVEVATAVVFTKGPTVDAKGCVYFSEQRSQRIMKLPVNGALSTFRENSNGANGLIFDSSWKLLEAETNPA